MNKTFWNKIKKDYPRLEINNKGEIRFAATIYLDNLILNFGNKPIKWIGLTKQQVKEFIDYLSEKYKEMK